LDGIGLNFPRRGTIGSLPDNVLLDIFDFYRMDPHSTPPVPRSTLLLKRKRKPPGTPRHYYYGQPWNVLVHVCQRWRYVVFASPRRLALRLVCKATTPVRRILDIWPCLPIIINDPRVKEHLDGKDVIAALKCHDRVCKINLGNLTSSLLKRLARVTKRPFPALTDLDLIANECNIEPVPALPDSFLGGSAPCLQSLCLSGIPFPGLPKLLRSSNDLVTLHLSDIPNTGYFSPETMAICLPALARLESLLITFQYPASRPDRRGPPPLKRVVLSALTKLEFKGVSEYFEDLVARIDTPVLSRVRVSFFNQLDFDIPQFALFVGRTESLGSFKRAKLFFNGRTANVTLHHDPPKGRDSLEEGVLSIDISCRAFDWQTSGLTHICTQLSPSFSSVEWVELNSTILKPLCLEDSPDYPQWLELFRHFIAVQSLDIDGLDMHIALALQELTGHRAMEVLPALRNLSFLTVRVDHNPVQEALHPFITARQLTNHPVTVNHL
jgi:hypothetical protein